MKSLRHILFLLIFILPLLVVPAQAQENPDADQPPSGAEETPPAETPHAPWIAAPQLLRAERELNFSAPQVETADAPQSLGGDWSNAAAWGCISPLAVVHNVAFGAGLTAAPPFDAYAAAVEYAANLGLKLCGPVLYPPGDFERGYNLDDQGRCGFTFHQPLWEGSYSNYLGIAIPWADVFPGKEWGDFGEPLVVHWNTDVDVSLNTPLAEPLGGDNYRLPVGLHNLTWRGDTQISPLDFIPRYIPGWAWTKLTKLLKLKKLPNRAIRETTETVLDFGFGQIGSIPTWDTMYNEEIQRVAVTDKIKPQISGSHNTNLEAIEPGGVSRRTFLYLLQRNLSVTDNCDGSPDLYAQNEITLPDFAPVGSSFTVEWIAEDRGPYSLEGATNKSDIFSQTFTVQDTLPPIIVPPPDIVTEESNLPVAVQLGHPGTFDLADLNPTVSHNACSQPGVVCANGQVRFPAGKTTVTWTAVDHAGNQSSTSQYVNIKNPGSNKRPTADNGSAQAISYEPVTLTLQAHDADKDRLWFQIDDQPKNGFFHSPLYPYFIQDYRVANTADIDVNDYCNHEEHRSETVPVSWPYKASFMAVDDDGNVYVHDNGKIRCLDHENGNTKEYRIAIFRPDGSWDQVTSSFDVKDMEVDWDQERLYVSRWGNNTNSLIRIFDLQLNQIVTYRMDNLKTPVQQPYNSAIDFEQNLLYVTNGYEFAGSTHLWVFKLPQPAADHDPRTFLAPEFLTEYDAPGGPAWQDLKVDSQGNLYASERDMDRIYKWSAARLDENGSFSPGQLVGWMGRCDSGPGCDSANGRSFGYSCSDATCSASTTSGSGPGQFDFPQGIALDNNDVLYVTDYNNRRVQRFTPEGFFAGQAVSECNGSCFVLGDFGYPDQVTVNSSHFYVLNKVQELLHVFETTPITRLNEDSAEIVYQSDNNFVGTETFTFHAGDGLADSVQATVKINVKRNHRPPVAEGPLAVSTLEDTKVAIPVDGYDPDEPLDTITFVAVDSPANGRFFKEGDTYYYLPNTDFEESESFTYAASDGTMLSEPQPVEVSITPVNDPPRFVEDGPTGFAWRSASTFSLDRLAQLGTEDAPMRIGRGFSTVFALTFADPDIGDRHLVEVNWGDGSPVQQEGKLLDDGTMTGPVLSEGTGGQGTVTAEHIFNENGDFEINFCVSDQVTEVNDQKAKTANSVTVCETVPVRVRGMVDLLVDIRPSLNPYPVGSPLSYDLVVTNQAPEGGGGLNATGVQVIDTLDDLLTAASATSEDGSCTISGITITCDLDALPPGESAQIHIPIQVPASVAPGMILANHAAYTVNEEDQADTQENGNLISVVEAADFVVNTIVDEPDADIGDGQCATEAGMCSLRAAMDEANANFGNWTISVADWQFLLNDELPLRYGITIKGLGAGQTIIAAGDENRLFHVASIGGLTLENLTLQGGSTTSDGGAILNDGTLKLNGVQISGSHADGSGGAIFNQGILEIRQSSISGNSAGSGAGGIDSPNSYGSLLMENVTISGNLGQSGGLAGASGGTLDNVTITNNQAAGSGGGIDGREGVFSLRNSIVAANSAVSGGPDCSGSFTSRGYNLLGQAGSCTINQKKSSDLVGRDSRLGTLDLNGGSTMNQAPRLDSPALDSGACALDVDQLGNRRPVDGNQDGHAACDIGAVEFVPVQVRMPLVRSP